ncbi:flagellin, partial [Eubacteriales bacterium OttesenSCG-928-N14]|nr:flagellin [Eubacteriales bacterium OttesenSCG-928-N14]
FAFGAGTFTYRLDKDVTAAELAEMFGAGDAYEVKEGTDFVVQTGANEGDTLQINIEKMDATTLGVKTTSVADRESASKAITIVDDAVNRVSSQRARLGALQNRLQHKINNLDTSAENLQAAESRIRDLDMAKEMTEFTKNNILSQASTAMLAQANAAPQGVLQLLS